MLNLIHQFPIFLKEAARAYFKSNGQWAYFDVMFHSWSDYCLTCPLYLLYSFWEAGVSLLLYFLPSHLLAFSLPSMYVFFFFQLFTHIHHCSIGWVSPQGKKVLCIPILHLGKWGARRKSNLSEVKQGFCSKVNNWMYMSFHFHEQPHSTLPFIWTTHRWSNGKEQALFNTVGPSTHTCSLVPCNTSVVCSWEWLNLCKDCKPLHWEYLYKKVAPFLC